MTDRHDSVNTYGPMDKRPHLWPAALGLALVDLSFSPQGASGYANEQVCRCHDEEGQPLGFRHLGARRGKQGPSFQAASPPGWDDLNLRHIPVRSREGVDSSGATYHPPLKRLVPEFFRFDRKSGC